MINIIIFTVVAVAILAFPLAWLFAELKEKPMKIRCLLGIIAISMSFGVAFLTAQIIRMGYNIEYSRSSENLVKSIIKRLESGDMETVLRELKELDERYDWRYDINSSEHYDEAVKDAVERINVD